MNDKMTWDILEEFFKTKGFVDHQISSYNAFVEYDIPRIVEDEPEIIIQKRDSDKIWEDISECMEDLSLEETEERKKKRKDKSKVTYTVSFGEVYIPNACIIENRELRYINPQEARLRDISYETPVYVDVIEKTEVDGNVISTNVNKRLCIARIPVMLKSSRCNLSKLTKQECINGGECEYDNGGYFILSGKDRSQERVIVAQVRNCYNKLIIIQQKSDSKMTYVGEIRSMSDETGHSVSVKASINKRDVMFMLPYITQPIPAGIVFKAMGYTNEDICKLVNVSSENAFKYIDYIIRDSYFIENQQDALAYIGKNSMHTITPDKHVDYAWQVVETELFPHMGITSTIHEKAIYLGHILEKIILTQVGERQPDDRDNYNNKRVESTGVLFAELFRTLYKKNIKSLAQQLVKRQNVSMHISKVNSGITTGLKYCISSGKWGMPKNAYVRTGVAQVLSRLSYTATVSHLRRISLPIGKEGKKVDIKLIHTSQYGFICPAESPEGQMIGSVLNLTLLSTITRKIPTVLVKSVIEDDENIINISQVELDDICNYTKIFLNGTIVGMTEDYEQFIINMKKKRQTPLLDNSVTIYYDDTDDEVHMYCDEGRIIKPVFTIENGKVKCQKVDTWTNLEKRNEVVWIDTSEAQMCNIATSIKDVTPDFHYCEINPAMMLGVCASTIPFPDHAPSPRNTYQSAMTKQAIGMVALSYQIRTDTMINVMNYPQKPLVKTKASTILGFDDMPSGINAIVAINTYSGLTLVKPMSHSNM